MAIAKKAAKSKPKAKAVKKPVASKPAVKKKATFHLFFIGMDLTQ